MITKSNIKFYRENGYLVIKNFLTQKKVDTLNLNYDKLRIKLAKKAEISFLDYKKEISQIRDIWKYDEVFKKLILEEEISVIAPFFFKENSCRLLHDHIINKPINNNGIVPWHQDYTYWPTDNPNGLSLWLPFNDLDECSGVLEIVPKSHLWGEKAPVDFINDVNVFPENEVKYLTVNKGDLIVLDALTWHRSSENKSIEERKAYISLWIPSSSRYAPKHASWHPVNDNVKVKEGQQLTEDWFPVIGNKVKKEQKHHYKDNTQTESTEKITMYNASKIASNFLKAQLGLKEDLWLFLYVRENRKNTIDLLKNKFNLNDTQENDLHEILLSMSINGIAYQNHRARNVYNKSYVKFKKIFKNEL